MISDCAIEYGELVVGDSAWSHTSSGLGSQRRGAWPSADAACPPYCGDSTSEFKVCNDVRIHPYRHRDFASWMELSHSTVEYDAARTKACDVLFVFFVTSFHYSLDQSLELWMLHEIFFSNSHKFEFQLNSNFVILLACVNFY